MMAIRGKHLSGIICRSAAGLALCTKGAAAMREQAFTVIACMFKSSDALRVFYPRAMNHALIRQLIVAPLQALTQEVCRN